MPESQDSQGQSNTSVSLPPSISSTDIIAFLDILPDGLVIVNQAGSIVLVNRQTEAIFGYASDELVGQRLELLLPQRFRAAHTIHRERYFSAPSMPSAAIAEDPSAS